MASSCEKLDQLVKDYLLFRGFTSTLKVLDQELKTDKDKGLRVDRMMEQIWTLLAGYDLPGLREYWKYLNQRLFSRLEQRYVTSVRKLESSLLKLYVVNAHQCNRQDKVLAFFEQMGAELQTHPDFKDWFAFPFVTNPSDNPTFSLYFNKQWQDTLQLSLHNFLSVVLQAMPVPTLLNVEFDARRMKTLQEENTLLKQQIMNASATGDNMKGIKASTRRNLQSELNPPASPPDMVYDFSGLADDSEPSGQEKPKSSRRFPLSLTSPLGGRKKSESSVSKSKATSSQANMSGGGVSSVLTGTLHSKQQQQPRSTEMSVFPPPSTKSSTPPLEGRKTPHSSSAASSQQPVPVISGGGGRLQLSGKHVSQVIANKQTSVHQVMTAAESLVVASSGPTPAYRSISVPETKAAVKERPPLTKHSSESTAGQASSNISLSGGTAVTSLSSNGMSGNKLSYSADLQCGSPLGADAESPFLLLEDEYTEHSSAATYCHFSMTGQYVASLDLDGVVKVWTWSPQPATTATIMSRSAFLSFAWASKSDRWLLLGNKTGSIRLFDVKESKTYREVLVNPDNPANCMRVTDLATSPSSMQFVCSTSDLCPFTNDLNTVSGRLLQWDLRTLKLERMLLVDSTVCNAITCCTYSQSGHLLLTAGADGFVRLYDANQQKPVMKWQANDTPIHSAQFHGDGAVYTMSADGNLGEWSLSQPGQQLNSISCGPRNIGSTTSGSCRGRLFSLDSVGHYLLTYRGRHGAIYKISGSSPPLCAMELKSHASPVVTVDWSPSIDTRVCLTGSTDGKIKISTLLSK